jgi:penicillin-insensitive murein DD-endopeptidase
MRENFDPVRSGAVRGAVVTIALALAATAPALAQDKGTLNQVLLPPLPHPEDPATPAKELSARKPTPAPMEARAIGTYVRGCLAGAVALPINGHTWQVMRLSRNRNWGHPALIEFLERLAEKVPKVAGWPGLLVGDIAQPRGAPMLTGHTSHQIGLDADIWLTPMPKRELSNEEREEMSAVDMVAADKLDVDRDKWTPRHGAVIKAAAQDPEVERVFVNAAIKKALCREAGSERGWLHKVRPWWGHDYHFHVRLACPADSPECKPQDAAGPDDGCGKELTSWFKDSILHPKPPPPDAKPPARRYMTMAALPPACKAVLNAP